MNDEYKIVASLNIYDYTGKLDLRELTKRIGIEPDEAVAKGERRHADDPLPLSNSIWSIHSRLSKTASPEEHIAWILKKVRPYKKEINRFSQQYKTLLAIGATYSDFNPEIVLEPEIASELGELGAKLWLDIYCLTKTHLEEDSKKASLTRALNKVDAIKELRAKDHDEGRALVEALSVLESCTSDILDWHLQDLIRAEPSERGEALVVLLQKLQKVKDHLGKSRLLSK